MEARVSRFARRVSDNVFQTVGVLVLSKRRLVFVAIDDLNWQRYGKIIEEAAAKTDETGWTLEEIFNAQTDRDMGYVSAWSKPESRSGPNEEAIGRAVLESDEFAAR